jgi:DNA-binding transcriptional ArsR family regulator
MHLPWLREAQVALSGVNLGLMTLLIPARKYIPDFLTPLPATPSPSIDVELEAMLRTPNEVIERDLRRFCGDYPDRTSLVQPLIANPRKTVERLAREVRQYWMKVLAPSWAKIHGVLEGDLLTRARSLALSGPDRLLNELHPLMHYADGTLHVNKNCPPDAVQEARTGGEGLLLVPSVFVAPSFLLYLDTPPTPAVIYPARGTALLWHAQRSTPSANLQELLGATRADLLLALVTPLTTGQLARRASFTQGAVSQHIGALRRAGVVETHRQGRLAFHQLTQAGQELVKIFG